MNLIRPDWPAPDNVGALISTRRGGQSRGAYADNNFALHVEDDEADVMANRERLREHLALPTDPQWLTQVHGTKVVAARADGRVRTADGCYSRTPGLACAVLTADCLPLLFCNRSGTQVAAIHAGWRGLAKGVVRRALSCFDEAPENLLVYLGPALSRQHFEVGVEVLEAFFRSAQDADHSERIAASFTPGARPLHFFWGSVRPGPGGIERPGRHRNLRRPLLHLRRVRALLFLSTRACYRPHGEPDMVGPLNGNTFFY